MPRVIIVFGALIFLTGVSRPALAQTETSTTQRETSPAPAAAQNDVLPSPKAGVPPVFITGAYGQGMDRSSHFVTNQPGGLQTNLSGNVTTRSFGIGTFVTPHMSVRFEMTLPNTLTVDNASTGTSVSEHLRVSQRTQMGAVLFGYHTAPTRRVSVEYLGGVAFLSQRQNSLSQVFDTAGAALNAPMETDAFSYKSTAVAGADVNIALARHLDIVPELRAWSLGGTFSFRTALAFRVNF